VKNFLSIAITALVSEIPIPYAYWFEIRFAHGLLKTFQSILSRAHLSWTSDICDLAVTKIEKVLGKAVASSSVIGFHTRQTFALLTAQPEPTIMG